MAEAHSQGAAYGSSFSPRTGKPLSPRAAASAGTGPAAQPGQAGKALGWLKIGWEGTKAAALEAAKRLDAMSPEDIGRLKKMLGPTGSVLGLGSAGLDAYQRYKDGQPLDEIAVRELAKLGLSTAGADLGGELGGAAGGATGYAAPVMIPIAGAAGALTGAVAGDWAGDKVGDGYAGLKRIPGEIGGAVAHGLQRIHDRYDPNNWSYDDRGRRIYDR
jgi:hypothetical protein